MAEAGQGLDPTMVNPGVEEDVDIYTSTSSTTSTAQENEDLPSQQQQQPSPLPLELVQYRDAINQRYERQVCQQQPLAYDKEFILDVEDTFTTIDYLPYNARRQAFDRQPLESIADIFNATFNPSCANPSRILLWGAPGIGKTTLIAKLLTEWNKRDVEVLQRFDFVFAIALRKVERTQSLLDCIFDQLMPEDDVHMKQVLENYLHRSNRVLIILDGYDELTLQLDKDHDIMKLLTGRLFPKASILVTTRPTCTSDVISKMKPDTRVEILGFSPDNVKSYILKFFKEQPTKGEELLKKIGPTLLSAGIFSVPILLLQVCLLWEDNKNVILSDKICLLYNQVVTCLVQRYGAKDKNPVPVEDVQTLIRALEKLAFECLLKEKAVTVFNQEDVFKYCGEHFTILVQLGLLKEQKSPSRTNPVVQYSFSHKTMQEYFAAQYLAERFTIEEAAKGEMLQYYFPTARKVQTLGEVLIFLCGKLGDKSKFVLHHLLDIHSTPNVHLVEEEFYNFFATGKSRKDWDKDLKLEDFASAEDLTHQFTGQWNDYPHVLLTYQSYIVLYLLCCHESGLTAQFAEQVFLRNTIQFSGASPRVYSVVSHMIDEESEKIKKMEHLRLVNTQNYVLGLTLEMLDKLSGLTELNLRQSRLGRHLPTCTIPRRLELRFKYRRILKTSEDDLAKAPALLARQLPLLRSLKKLVISWNDLGPEDMKELLPAMKELRNLEELFLSGNDLGGLGKDVADLVAFLPKLKVFKVYFCQLTFAEIQMIASSLTDNCPDLELFDFQLNPIQSDESIWIGEREMDTVKAALRDQVFVPSGARKLPPTQQGP
ncbi:NACHT, LRR and PYD domains-containing protein 1b allele 5-like [Branchiostoma lanceolatum]|uniref:NACHT, LRR and PYD domains-containing protein 1b allele 5-like n=1 Tax=Branchiostoma lanceolatum TaxID=7740 RepID=UPI003455CEBD